VGTGNYMAGAEHKQKQHAVVGQFGFLPAITNPLPWQQGGEV